jgi:hypothetical protein
MGGNEIVLLKGSQIRAGEELEAALCLLDPPNVRGHQGVLLYPGKENQLIAKIVSVSSRGFISSCGGLTQVLGKILAETEFLQDFGVRLNEPQAEVELLTDAGKFEIIIEHRDRAAERVFSVMNPFVEECYQVGVRCLEIGGVAVTQVGRILVLDGDDLRKIYPDINLENMDEATTQALSAVQQRFLADVFQGKEMGYFAVYDFHPRRSGEARAVFPHNIDVGHIEPSCGTGTVAIGIAVLESGKRSPAAGKLSLTFETGGSATGIGGPNHTQLEIGVGENGRVTEARFTHDLVEIIATGQARIRQDAGLL